MDLNESIDMKEEIEIIKKKKWEKKGEKKKMKCNKMDEKVKVEDINGKMRIKIMKNRIGSDMEVKRGLMKIGCIEIMGWNDDVECIMVEKEIKEKIEGKGRENWKKDWRNGGNKRKKG